MASASDATLSSRRWDPDAWSCPDPARCVRCDSTIASPSTPGSVVVSFNQAAIEKHLQEDVQEEEDDEDRWFLMGCNRPYQYQPLPHEDHEDHSEDTSKQKNERCKDIQSESSDILKEEEYKDSEDEALLLDLEEDDREQHCTKKFAEIKKKRTKNASSSSDDSSSGSDSTLSSSSSSSSESESDSSSSSDSSASSSTSTSSSSSSTSSESSESSSSNSLSLVSETLSSSQVNLYNSNAQGLGRNNLDDAEEKHQSEYFDAVTDLMMDNQKEMLKNADYFLGESNIVFGESLLIGTTDNLCGDEDQNTLSNLLLNQNEKR